MAGRILSKRAKKPGALSHQDLLRYLAAVHATEIANLQADKAILRKQAIEARCTAQMLELHQQIAEQAQEATSAVGDHQRVLTIARQAARDLGCELSDTYGVDLTTYGIDTQTGAFVLPPEA